ncbi:MAG: HlyU family transcriptional regulator [Ahrensia sp.]|nr:HlyU family transcriptional regulator [Ahrensia sp.]
MSFFKRLLGKAEEASAKPAAQESYKGFDIVATPQSDGGQYRLHGTISKQVDGEVKQHVLIRADLFPDTKQCAEVTLRKAKQVIDEQGDRLLG